MDGITFNFFKLTVPDADKAEAFYADVFGMARQNVVDTKGFKEIMLASPKGKFTLVLFQWKDGREIQIGNGYGPLGFITPDLEKSIAAAEDAGAVKKGDIVSFGGAKIMFMTSPDGHELELIERPAAAA
jgi:lactoylglutathione lyase